MSEHFPLMVPGAAAAGEPAVISLDRSIARRLPPSSKWTSPAPNKPWPLPTGSSATVTAGSAPRGGSRTLARGGHHPAAGANRPEAAHEGGKPLVDSLIEADRAVD